MAQRRTELPNPRLVPRFAGVATFCRYPMLAQVAPENQPVDWAIYGYPFDGGVTFRPGARFGPRAVRDASQYVKPYSIAHDVDVCQVLSLADAGDTPICPFSVKDTLDATVEFATGLGDPAVTRLLAVGGDHSLAYANIKATWQRRGSPAGGLAMIHFDSHLDTVDVTGGSKWTHASPFIRAIEEGVLDPSRMISIGIKGPLNTARDLDYAREHGINVVTYERWRREGTDPIDRFVADLGSEGLPDLRHRFHRSDVRPRDRHALPRRVHLRRGVRAAPVPGRDQSRRRRCRRGAARSGRRRNHGPAGRARPVRDPVPVGNRSALNEIDPALGH